MIKSKRKRKMRLKKRKIKNNLIMSKTFKKVVVIILVISLFLTGVGSVFGQDTLSEQERAQEEKRLKQLKAAILEKKRNLVGLQAKGQRYQHQIRELEKEIGNLNTQIRQAKSRIRTLTGQIKETEASIDVTLAEIEKLRGRLTEILRAIDREDSKSKVEIMLAEQNISDHFDNSFSIEILSNETRNLLGEIITLKVSLEEKKEVLGETKSKTELIVKDREFQAKMEERKRVAQEALLKKVQNQEIEKKQEIARLEKEAAAIEAKLLRLPGLLTGTPQPDLKEALDIARWVQGHTGVQPAFLLAIIIQESALGRNVGQCYITDTTSGSTKNRFGTVFPRGIREDSERRDLTAFLQITRDLGMDPFKTPVSCWIYFPSKGPNWGFGGALGPAQFLPTTWKTVSDEVTRILGSANPWNIRDSFLGAGIYLMRRGAANCELTAARRYFGTSTLGYGSSVMRIRGCLQAVIDRRPITPACHKLIGSYLD